MKLSKRKIDKLIDEYNNFTYKDLVKSKDNLPFKLKKTYINKKSIEIFMDLVKENIKENLSIYKKHKISYKNEVYLLPDFYALNNIPIQVKEKFIFKFLYDKNPDFKNKFEKKYNKILTKHLILKSLSFVGTFLLFLTVGLYLTLKVVCYGPSTKARNMFVSTFLETGMLKFIPRLVMSEKEINNIVNKNNLLEFNEEIDTDKVVVNEETKTDEIEIKKVYGNNFFGMMMIVHDPSRVKLATTYPFSKYGKELNEIVELNNAIGAVNGGLYESLGNHGGYPVGVVVSNGQIQYNDPNGKGYHLIGFDTDNKLRILSLVGLDANGVTELVKKEKIRDAVTFQEEFSDANNHFVKLIINGENRKTNGLGSGANPRTAIGQRADGTVLFLVTDGRGISGHLGATASDLIDVMSKYGAVNAANIDGGSSSSMFYKGEYLMTSVTLYYSNSSWRLPDAFIVTK